MEPFSQHNEQEHLNEDILNEYLDGYLSAEHKAFVDKHLAVCPVCADQFQQLQTLFAALEALPEVSVEHDLSRQVLKSINSKPQIPVFVKWSILPQLVIALFILLSLLPKYLQSWLVLLPKATSLQVDLNMLHWIGQSREWFDSIRFSMPAWQFSSLDIGFQFPALNQINWLLFAAVVLTLMIINGYLLRQVVRNDSH